MRINTNIASLTAQRNLANTTRAFARALERLSSGKRINRAGDDAAGLAISERLQSQVRGMQQVARNINDAFGFLNTADGAISTQMDIVQRMRELALQSSNGTLGVSERESLDNEFQTLLAEFSRIAQETEFNGVSLLDGTFTTAAIQVGVNKAETINFSIHSALQDDIFELTTSTTSTVASGTFASSSFTSTGSRPKDIASGDFNGDGNLDFIYAGEGALGNTNAVVRLGNGVGGFTVSQTIALPAMNDGSVVAGDFNGDSVLDLAICLDSGADVSIQRGNGDGTFSQGATVTARGVVKSVGTGDFNSDGNLDLLTANGTDNSVSYFEGDGTGGFTDMGRVITGDVTTLGSLAVGDFNGDTFEDFAVTGTGGGVRVRLGDGAGGFSVAAGVSAGAAPSYLRLADLNGDDILDMVVSNVNSSTISVRLGDGSGGFTGTTNYATSSIPRGLAIGDINGDGSNDIIVGSASGVNLPVFLNDGSGAFSTGTTITLSDQNPYVHLGDFNNDDILDLIASDGNGSPFGFNFLAGNSTTQTTGVTVSLSILTQSNAQNLLPILEAARESLVAIRSNLGATQNRLEFAASNSLIMTENINAARSQIIDADIAEETAELTRAQILQQAGVSVLGQANTSLQMVLGLLRF